MMRIRTKTKIRIASLLYWLVSKYRYIMGKKNHGIFRRGNIYWNLNLSEGIDFSIYLFGKYERMTYLAYRKLITPGAIIIDIGANIGGHCLQLAECVGNKGHVYAIEPTIYALEKLRENLDLNPVFNRRVSTHQVLCISHENNDEIKRLYSSWPLTEERGIHVNHRGVLKDIDGATVCSLDEFIVTNKIDHVDLIKIDVDGHEHVILQGARTTLKKMKPTLIMELAPYVLDEEEGALESVLTELNEAGYNLIELSSNNILQLNPEKIRSLIPYGAGINVLAKKCD